jgi:hypothetical protein
MKYGFICLLLVSISISSCHFLHEKRIKGDGNVIVQTRSVGAFNQVEISTALQVILVPDSATSIKVETDSNLQGYIEVYTEGAVLHIHQKSNTSISSSKPTKVYVSAPVFESLHASGACKITATDTIRFNGQFDLELDGASEAELLVNATGIKLDMNGASVAGLKGATTDFVVNAGGSCTINAFGLSATNVDVELDGASTAEVYPSAKLIAEANGASNVLYKGNVAPAYTLNGASRISRVD